MGNVQGEFSLCLTKLEESTLHIHNIVTSTANFKTESMNATYLRVRRQSIAGIFILVLLHASP